MAAKKEEPIITYDEVFEIYKIRKEGKTGYNFIKDIFDELKPQYIEIAISRGKNGSQSWNSWSGKALQNLIERIVIEFVKNSQYPIGITSNDELMVKNLSHTLDTIKRNIVVFYNEIGIVPDADIIIYDKNLLKVIAVLSSKASLRERIAQAAYWKKKFVESKVTNGILCYLVSTDNDGDFIQKDKRGNELSRSRIIVEYGELDGAYIFREIPESNKIKNFDQIEADLLKIFDRWFNASQNKSTLN